METLFYLSKNKLLSVIGICPVKFSFRNVKSFRRRRVRTIFGVPPYKGKSIEQKLQEYDYKDPSVHYKVNIGLPQQPIENKIKLNEQTAYLKKMKENLEFEKKARKNELFVDLDEVTKEWFNENGPQHISSAAEHYGVFQDLFGDAFFYPRVSLDVVYKTDEGLVPVCRGNLMKPCQALSTPIVTYKSEPDTLWTLVVSNPDGHIHQENAEYLHWLVGNIPESEITKGEVVAEYIQPFPARGTGFQRFIFILYKQLGKMDYSSLSIPPKEVNWNKRTFNTYDFYRARQHQLTPAGLVFCQVDWDLSVSNFYHTVLDMEEPRFEYDFDAPYHPRQKMYPIKQPFNLYMDRYRDPKQIAKEYLLRKLQKTHPFEKPKPPPKYPNAVRVYHDLDERIFGRVPSWLKREKLKSRLGYGRIQEY